MDQILKTLEDNATLTPEQLAVMLDKEVGEIRDLIKKYEAEGKDTSNLVADRDYALYMLGLGEKPERQAKVIL